ncbi:hypothetical protein OEB96_33775 [Paraliomyxa miuraensis]|nr:hypothetical protein [Paraliomyxa miuraensis]
MHLPGAGDLPPPYVDERLVEPETRHEMVRGRLIHAVPANPEHADEHAELDYLARATLTPGYAVASDLLTRAGPGSDFATDTCIRREGIDPRTGSRYLEEVAFEVVDRQSRQHATERAQDLASRGVRRIFAVFVGKKEVCEWSRSEDRFVPLAADAAIEDPTLVYPLPVRALFDPVEADRAVGHALEAKGNPVFDEARAEGRIQAIELLCRVLEIPFGPRERAHLQRIDVDALAALLAELEANRRWPDG